MTGYNPNARVTGFDLARLEKRIDALEKRKERDAAEQRHAALVAAVREANARLTSVIGISEKDAALLNTIQDRLDAALDAAGNGHEA